ncbi:unnamed protein product [Cyprideis torosa]|uniref:TMEM62 Ig-like domain-containing protein n=1 Tax=Cyprideis torosa TaxID=163714 RepID=A0A7R8WI54_9CRUS|nr:unnamed protein product [Cyprideis torosa]CAG0900311.1 unnamed protein product [Cyprideis torosa]
MLVTRYRVLAVDHGFLSFSDVRNADYPIVLVTYPKDARFHLPYHEPSSLLLEGTHIRILALSPVGVHSVAVCLEGEMTCVPATRERVKPRYPEHVWPLASESLFTRRWNPEQYGTGLHQLEVIVVDNQGETKTVRHIFSLDGTSRRLGLFSHWFLLCDLRHVFMVNCFMVMFGLIIIPLCVLRYLALCFEGGYHQLPELNPGSPVSLVFHDQMKLVSVDRIFWLFLFYPLIISVYEKQQFCWYHGAARKLRYVRSESIDYNFFLRMTPRTTLDSITIPLASLPGFRSRSPRSPII